MIIVKVEHGSQLKQHPNKINVFVEQSIDFEQYLNYDLYNLYSNFDKVENYNRNINPDIAFTIQGGDFV